MNFPVLILDQNYRVLTISDHNSVKLKIAKLLCKHNFKQEKVYLEIVNEYQSQMNLFGIKMFIPSIVRITKKINLTNNKKDTAPYSRRNILIRDNFQCCYCGTKLTLSSLTLDHVIPKSKGGKASWNNIVSSCKKCNAKKANLSLKESGMKLNRIPKEVFLDQNYRLQKVINYIKQFEYPPEWIPYLKSINIK